MNNLDSMNLDEGVKEPIRLLLENGFQTTASCDGVLAHHEGIDYGMGQGYIALNINDKTLDLIALCYEKGFDFSISNRCSNEEHELYGQKTYGNQLSLQFSNLNGENTNNVLETIKAFINGEKPSEKYAKLIHSFNDILKENDEESELSFALLSLLGIGERAFPTLVIRSKDNVVNRFDANDISKMLDERFDIKECKPNHETLKNNMQLVKFNSIIHVKFDINQLEDTKEIIKFLKDKEKDIKRI